MGLGGIHIGWRREQSISNKGIWSSGMILTWVREVRVWFSERPVIKSSFVSLVKAVEGSRDWDVTNSIRARHTLWDLTSVEEDNKAFQTRAFGLVVWFFLWVREVLSSILGMPLLELLLIQRPTLFISLMLLRLWIMLSQRCDLGLSN